MLRFTRHSYKFLFCFVFSRISSPEVIFQRKLMDYSKGIFQSRIQHSNFSLGFALDGGAEEGKLLCVDSIDPGRLSYRRPELGILQEIWYDFSGRINRGELRSGDIILEVRLLNFLMQSFSLFSALDRCNSRANLVFYQRYLKHDHRFSAFCKYPCVIITEYVLVHFRERLFGWLFDWLIVLRCLSVCLSMIDWLTDWLIEIYFGCSSQAQGLNVAGLRKRDLLQLFDTIPSVTGTLVLKCLPEGYLKSTDLAEILGPDYPMKSPHYRLQSAVVENLLTLSPAVTTRPPRDGEKHGKDFDFVREEEFTEMHRLKRIPRYKCLPDGEIWSYMRLIDWLLDSSIIWAIDWLIDWLIDWWAIPCRFRYLPVSQTDRFSFFSD